MNLSLEQVVSLDYLDDEYLEKAESTDLVPYNSYDLVEKHFVKVFDNVKDIKNNVIGEKIKFSQNDYKIIIKCDISNSMDFCYNLLNKHVPAMQKTYFIDDSANTTDDFDDLVEMNQVNNLPDDVAKIIEFIHFLANLKIPQEFVAGFLILMIKYKYII